MKPQIRIIDNIFSHAPNSFGCGDLVGITPQKFEWARSNESIGDIVVITETSIHLVDTLTEKIKILLVIESPLINPSLYASLRNPDIYNKFTHILTFSKELVALDPTKFVWYQFGGCWIYPDSRMVYPKTKNVSIIASAKSLTEGHRLRHDAISNFRSILEGVFGNGYQFLPNKLDGLKDFRYSIVIENDSCESMLSEKLLDCFVTGTIPIYWGNGHKNIGEWFNVHGVLQFTDLNQLDAALKLATEEYYNANIDAVTENFNAAKQYCCPEDAIWNSFFNQFFIK